MLKELVSESENDNGVLGELQQPPLTSTGSNESAMNLGNSDRTSKTKAGSIYKVVNGTRRKVGVKVHSADLCEGLSGCVGVEATTVIVKSSDIEASESTTVEAEVGSLTNYSQLHDPILQSYEDVLNADQFKHQQPPLVKYATGGMAPFPGRWNYHPITNYQPTVFTMPENEKYRKMKCKKHKKDEKNVLNAEDVEGYNGNKDIDSLLQFIGEGEEDKRRSKKSSVKNKKATNIPKTSAVKDNQKMKKKKEDPVKPTVTKKLEAETIDSVFNVDGDGIEIDKHNGTETNNSELLVQPAESHEDKGFTDGTIDFSEKLEVIGSREVEINTIKNKIDKNQKKLQDHRKKFEEMRNLQAKSMSKCLEGIEESEQAKKGFLKDIDVLSNEIEKLQRKVKELNDKCFQCDLKIVNGKEKQKKIDNFIDREREKFKIEEVMIVRETTELQMALENNLQAIDTEKAVSRSKPKPPDIVLNENVTNDAAANALNLDPNKKLIEFLRKSISDKEADLECPVCLETAEGDIYSCQEQHLICSTCRPRVKECPECRVAYKGPLRRHRYAEKTAVELRKLREELSQLLKGD